MNAVKSESAWKLRLRKSLVMEPMGLSLRSRSYCSLKKKSGPYKGLWGLPGGVIEFGETPEMTLNEKFKKK